MKIKFLMTLALTLVSVLFLVKNSPAQKLTLFKKMYETQIADYGMESYPTFCIDFSRLRRVCKGAQSESGEIELLIQENKKTIRKVTTSDGTIFDNRFWVYQGNLDKSASDELIIVDYNGWSNGLGITYFTSYIFANTRNGFKKTLEFPLEEFGERGNFIYDKARNETLILVTYWDSFANLDLNRVPWGTYLTGKWFRYRQDLLQPVFAKPTLARRLLNSFMNERGNTSDNSQAPYVWLQNKRTHRFFKEPKYVEKLIETKFGTVQNFADDTFTLRLNSGETVSYTLGCCPADYDKTPRLTVKDFGLWPQKFIYPSHFSDKFTPLMVFDKVNGKKVKLEIYQTSYNLKFIRLWFFEKRTNNQKILLPSN